MDSNYKHILVEITELQGLAACVHKVSKSVTIAHRLFKKDTVGSLTSTNECWQTGSQCNVHPRDGTHTDESPCLGNTRMAVCSSVEIQTQSRRLRGGGFSMLADAIINLRHSEKLLWLGHFHITVANDFTCITRSQIVRERKKTDSKYN